MNEAATPSPVSPVQYGRFTYRMLASTLDLGALFMIALPMVDYIMLWLFEPMDNEKIAAVFNAQTFKGDTAIAISRLWAVLLEQHVPARMLAENFLQFAFIALYTLPFWMHFSSTPGKMFFRMRIQDERTGLPMTKRQCVGRFLSYFVSGLPFSLGFAWIALNKKRKGFHDYLAGTVVTVKPPKQPQLNSSI